MSVYSLQSLQSTLIVPYVRKKLFFPHPHPDPSVLKLLMVLPSPYIPRLLHLRRNRKQTHPYQQLSVKLRSRMT